MKDIQYFVREKGAKPRSRWKRIKTFGEYREAARYCDAMQANFPDRQYVINFELFEPLESRWHNE